VLWYSFGSITALLQEIISVYPMLSPPTLTSQASNRVCNALALLQCVASHAETKSKLVKSESNDVSVSKIFNICLFLFFDLAQIPLYLYPFLNTVSRHRPFEYLRLTSLGVIGALVKVF
jgi:CCR4-NOT transcription complex subunit 9